MAELTSQERLQPSLLDRLTDDEPQKKVESRDRRVLSLNRLRQCVLRDLSWVLNTGSLESLVDLSKFPQVVNSVLNYGMRDLSGSTASGTDKREVERRVRRAVLDFEPRILTDTVRVKAVVSQDQMNMNALTFEIEGMLWAEPLPLHLFLKTEVDLETGNVTVSERSGPGRS